MRGFITIMDSLSPKLSANTQEPGNEAISPLVHFLQGWPASFIYEYKVYGWMWNCDFSSGGYSIWLSYLIIKYYQPGRWSWPGRNEKAFIMWQSLGVLFHCVHQSTIVQTFHYIRLGSHTAGYVCTMHVHRPYKIKSVLQSFKQYGNTIEKAIE